MTCILFTLVYCILQTAVTLYFLENKYVVQVKGLKRILSAIAFVFVCFGASCVNMFFLDSIAVLLCSIAFLQICCRANVLSSVADSIVLGVIYLVSKSAVVFFNSAVFGVNADVIEKSNFLIAMSNIFSIAIYLGAVYILVKISNRGIQTITKASLTLLLMPLTTAFVSTLCIALYMDGISHKFKLLMSTGALLLLVANIVSFYVYEFSVKTHFNSEKIKIQNQELINRDLYYEELKRQNENSRILVHDISKHLNTIGNMKDNSTDVKRYIRNITGDFGITNPVDYSCSPTLNLITHKYYQLCRQQNIRFDVNIREAKMDFMQTPDITAMFENLLENALEASKLSENGFIDFSAYVRNKNFLMIKITNSCAIKPEAAYGELLSSKKSPFHGFGTKSIRRVVKKYNGEVQMNFNENDNTFEVIAMLATDIVH